jgi:DNA-directed RNA polymerase III subunit RPC4
MKLDNQLINEVDKAIINDKGAPAPAPTPAPAINPPAAARKIKRRSSTKDKKPVIQTAEDREEYERHIKDMRVLKDELANVQHGPKATARDGVGNIEMGEGITEKADNLAGRLYLFQFPPVLPKLYDPQTQEKPALSKGEDEFKKEIDPDVEMVGSATKTPAPGDPKGKGNDQG